jgi:hypothetical protein
MGRIVHTLLVGDKLPNRPNRHPLTTPYHKKVTTMSFRRRNVGALGSLARGVYLSVDCWYGRRDGHAAAAGNQGTAS